MKVMMNDQVDVVVVGAGLSGLVAARELRRHGIDVLVLEAADRCGGRVYTETSVLGSRLDLGGQWIGHDHHRLAALVDELGATRFVMHTGPLPAIIAGSRRIRVLSPPMLVAVASIVGLELIRRTQRPARWSSVSVSDWLQRVPGRARRLLEVAAFISWTADLDRVSIQTMMSLIRGQGGLVTMLSTKGGAQDSLIAEGVGSLIDAITEELGPAIRTGAHVAEIVRDDEGATVRTSIGDLRASKVIIAVPPPMAARITHEPELPGSRRTLEQETFMGSVYKAVAVFHEPFWRPRSNGELLILDDPGIAVFDTSAPGGPGHLCLLVGGPEARALDALSVTERRTTLLTPLAEQLGPNVLEPVSWHEKAWHLDPHAGGGYIALPVLDAADPVVPMPADPIGPLHWAGAETAREHPGYLDGAIEAGERAAREVIGTPILRR